MFVLQQGVKLLIHIDYSLSLSLFREKKKNICNSREITGVTEFSPSVTTCNMRNGLRAFPPLVACGRSRSVQSPGWRTGSEVQDFAVASPRSHAQ